MISMLALTVLALTRAETASPAKSDSASAVSVVQPVETPQPAPVAKAVGPVGGRRAPKSIDTSTTFDRYGSWQFGFAGGSSSGGGLAVRKWFDDKNGIELHGYIYLNKKTLPEDRNSGFGSMEGSDGYYYGDDSGTVAQGEISLGVQYLHEVLRVHLFDGTGLFKGGNHLRGLTFVGIGGYSEFEDRELRSRFSNPNAGEKHFETQKVLGGGGAGLELELNRFSLHALIGYGGFYGLSSDTYELGSTFDGGLFVRF
jgi:hypothetical protein